MATWQVQQAKTHFSELLEDAQTKGPQIITKHGSETAVVLSITEYKKLASPPPQRMDLRDFLLNSPKFDFEDDFFDNLRDRTDTGRNIDFLFEDDK
jgi:antitoxin Phd